MKKTMKNAAIGLFTLLAVTTGFTASANEKLTGAELKIAGEVNNQPVFQLDLNNGVKEKFVILITDEYGTILLEDFVSGVNISKKFRFSDELEGINLRFEIRDIKNKKTVTFEVKNRKKTVLETAIVKS